ncbi:MAG: hypothetical protein N2B06_06090 [Clostridium sp.]
MIDYENDKKKGNKDSPHSMKRMMSLMLLCCGLPILLIAILPFLKNGNSGTLVSLIFFLCPLMMLFMVPMMLKGFKKDKPGPDKEKHL